MLTRALLCATLLAAGCGGAAPSDPAPAPAPPPAATPAAPAPASGLGSIRAADLRAHVELLASDAYAGRETLRDGARLAADHLARELASYGLSPMPGRTDHRVGYTLYELGYDAERTALAVTAGGATQTFEPGVDFTPFRFSDEGVHEAEVVFAGYGITAPDLDHDDYAGLDVAGKIALVLRHAPNEDREDSSFDGTRHALFATKAANAHEHGAIGMILVTDPRHHDGGDDLRLGGILLTEKRELPAGDEKTKPDEPPFLAVHVSRAVAEAMVAPTGKTLLQIQQALDDGARASAFALQDVTASLAVTARDGYRELTAHNVAGFLEGADPVLRDEWVVIGAHYDHLGAFHGDTGDTVFNGADDNASGTAAMLELAQAFAARPDRPARSILFVGFSGEEKGLLGSRALIDQEILPIDKVAFMLNLDMIGRNPDEPVAVVGDGYATGIAEVVAAASAAVDLPIELGGADYAGNSDHHPFYASDVPFLFFFTGIHDDYHQLSDHADKLAYDRMERIARAAYGTADAVASGAVTPRFIHHVSWLGVQVQVTDAGAVITEVGDDSRARDAGLAVGDVIRHFGDQPLDDPAKVGESFRGIEPGTQLSLGVVRDGEPKSIRIERAKRGYLGVVPARVSEDERKALGLGEDEGIRIASLANDGPAGAAGIRAGDILIRIRGLPVGPRTLGHHLARIGAGEQVEVVVVRDGERIDLDLVLGERPERRRRP